MSNGQNDEPPIFDDQEDQPYNAEDWDDNLTEFYDFEDLDLIQNNYIDAGNNSETEDDNYEENTDLDDTESEPYDYYQQNVDMGTQPDPVEIINIDDPREEFYVSCYSRKIKFNEELEQFIFNYNPQKWFIGDNLSNIDNIDSETLATISNQQTITLINTISELTQYISDKYIKNQISNIMNSVVEYISKFTLWDFKNNLTIDDKLFMIILIECGLKFSNIDILDALFCSKYYKEQFLWESAGITFYEAISINPNKNYLEYCLDKGFIKDIDIFSQNSVGFSHYHLSIMNSPANVRIILNRFANKKEEFNKPLKNTGLTPFMLSCEVGSVSALQLLPYLDKNSFQQEFYNRETCLSVSAKKNSFIFEKLLESEFADDEFIKKKTYSGDLFKVCLENPESICCMLEKNLVSIEDLVSGKYNILKTIVRSETATKKILNLGLDKTIFKREIKTIFKSKYFLHFLNSECINNDVLNTDPPFLIDCLRENSLVSLLNNGINIQILLKNLETLLNSEKFTKELFDKSININSINRVEIIRCVINNSYFNEEFIIKNIDTINKHFLVIDIYNCIIDQNKLVEPLLENSNFVQMSSNLEEDQFSKVCSKLSFKHVIDSEIVSYLVNNKLLLSFNILINSNKDFINIIQEKEYDLICSNNEFLIAVLENNNLEVEYLKKNNLRGKILNKVLDKGGKIIALVIDKLYSEEDKPDLKDNIFDIFVKSIKIDLESVKAIEKIQGFNNSIFKQQDENGNTFLHHIFSNSNENETMLMFNYYKDKGKIDIELINTQNKLGENCLYTAIEHNPNYANLLFDNKLINKESFSHRDTDNYTTFFRLVATDNIKLIRQSLNYIDKTIFDASLGENNRIFSYVVNEYSTESFLKDETLLLLVDSEFFDEDSINHYYSMPIIKGISIPNMKSIYKKIHIFVNLVRHNRLKTVMKIVDKLNKKEFLELEDENGSSILMCSYQNAQLFRYFLNHKFMTKEILQKINKMGYNILTLLSNRIDEITTDKIPKSLLLKDVLTHQFCDKNFIEKDMFNKDLMSVCMNHSLLIKILFELEDNKISTEFVNGHIINNNTLFYEITKTESRELITDFILSRFFNIKDLFVYRDNLSSDELFQTYLTLYPTLTIRDKEAINKLLEELANLEENELFENLVYPDKENNFLINVLKFETADFFREFLQIMSENKVRLDKLFINYRNFLDACLYKPSVFEVFISSDYFNENILNITNRYGHSYLSNIVLSWLHLKDLKKINIFETDIIIKTKIKYCGDNDNDRLPMIFSDKHIKDFNILIDKHFIDKKCIELANNMGQNSLMKSIYEGNYKIAETILDKLFTQNSLSFKDINKRNVIHYIFSDIKLVKRFLNKLLEKDISIYSYLSKDNNGDTPLHNLVKTKITQEDFSKLLNNFNTSTIFEPIDSMGRNLYLLCCDERKDLLECFYTHPDFELSHIETRDKDHNSVFYKLKNDPKSLKSLLEKYNLDPNLMMKYHSDNGSVLLEMAKNYTESFKTVLELFKGLTYNILEARDKDRFSVLHICFKYNAEALEFLLNTDLDLNYLIDKYSNFFGVNNPLILGCQYNPLSVKVFCESKYKYKLEKLILKTDIDEKKYAHFIALECQPLALYYLIQSKIIPNNIWEIPYSNGYKIINHIKLGNSNINTLDQYCKLEFIKEINEISINEDDECGVCGEFKAKIKFDADQCNHKLCVACAVRAKTCPMCRALIKRKYIDIHS